jgi:membrane protein
VSGHPLEGLPRRLVDRTPDRARPGVELVVRTVVDAVRDRVPGLSAEVAFFLILSLPPLLITVFAGAALADVVLGADVIAGATQQTRQVSGQFLTAEAAEDVVALVTTVRRQVTERAGALLSFGFVLTLFSASRALRVTTVAITIAYDLEDNRPGWQQFVYGLSLTVVALLAGLFVVPLLVVGPELGQALVDWFNAPQLVAALWRIAYWPAAAAVATLLLACLYHVAAPWATPWRRDLPGAAVAMAVGLAGSSLLRTYATRAVSEDLFGALAAPLVLLLWLYVMSFAVLFGAELNAEIERMWPTTPVDDPGSAPPGVLAQRGASTSDDHAGG